MAAEVAQRRDQSAAVASPSHQGVNPGHRITLFGPYWIKKTLGLVLVMKDALLSSLHNDAFTCTAEKNNLKTCFVCVEENVNICTHSSGPVPPITLTAVRVGCSPPPTPPTNSAARLPGQCESTIRDTETCGKKCTLHNQAAAVL